MRIADKIKTPYYDVIIPLSKKKTKYRPFLVREEKALLAAYESEDELVMLSTLIEVVKATLQDTVENLTTFDIEYLFVQIRSKLVGEYSVVSIKCDSCEASSQIKLNLKLAEVAFPKEFKNSIIKLNDNISVKMMLPSIETTSALLQEKDESVVIAECIETIYIDEESYNRSESTSEEIAEFLDSLTGKEFDLLRQFKDNIPYCRVPLKYTCVHCGKEHDKFIKGLQNFF